MRIFTANLKMNKAEDGKNGGGQTTQPEVKSGAAPDAKESQADGDQLDDFGYAITAEETQGKPDAKGDAPKAPEKPEPEEPVTGYGKKPLEAPAEEEKKKDEPPPVKDELELNTEGVPKEEIEKVRTFAKQHKVSKEIAQAFLELRKGEIKAQAEADAKAAADYEKAKKRQWAEWDKELRADQTFGGDKFEFNLNRVEKVMSEFMVNTKKRLTESKGVLPPYLMRDLAKLADRLYETEKFVQGESTKPEADDEIENNDPLEFYQ